MPSPGQLTLAVEQGVVSARDSNFAAQRTRRADLEQEILLVDRLGRLGEVILKKLRSDDTTLRQGYARRFIAKIVVAPDIITIKGRSSRWKSRLAEIPTASTDGVLA